MIKRSQNKHDINKRYAEVWFQDAKEYISEVKKNKVIFSYITVI